MEGSIPGSVIHGIFQARILEWAAISFSSKDFFNRIQKAGTQKFNWTSAK